MIVVTFVFPVAFAHIYTDNVQLITACIPVMRVVSVAILFCAVGGIIFSGVSGTGNTRTAFAIEFLTLFFYLSYVYYTASSIPVPWPWYGCRNSFTGPLSADWVIFTC